MSVAQIVSDKMTENVPAATWRRTIRMIFMTQLTLLRLFIFGPPCFDVNVRLARLVARTNFRAALSRRGTGCPVYAAVDIFEL